MPKAQQWFIYWPKNWNNPAVKLHELKHWRRATKEQAWEARPVKKYQGIQVPASYFHCWLLYGTKILWEISEEEAPDASG